MPFGDSITGSYEINLDSVILKSYGLQHLSCAFGQGSDMAGNSFGSVSDEVYTPFAVWYWNSSCQNTH